MLEKNVFLFRNLVILILSIQYTSLVIFDTPFFVKCKGLD